jgi:hypothetical protein
MVWNPNSKVHDLYFWNNGVLIEIKSIEVVKILFDIWKLSLNYFSWILIQNWNTT